MNVIENECQAGVPAESTSTSTTTGQGAIRIAAIGDLHVRDEAPPGIAAALQEVATQVDLLVIAGDITEGGRLPEAELAVSLLGDIAIPKVAVLGNHDRRGPRRVAFRKLIESAGITLLDGDAFVHQLPDGKRVGFAGVGGYGGGFWPEEDPHVPGARLSKAVGMRARREANRLEAALLALDRQRLDAVIVLMHYAPTTSTLGGEPVLKYWMLGNSLLGRVIDEHNVDLVIHGHAHLGNQFGRTPGGTPVRNVAMQVTGGIMVYDVERGKRIETVPDLSIRLDPVTVSSRDNEDPGARAR